MIINFKGKIEYFEIVLGTRGEQIKAKDQFKKFGENLKQYLLK